MITLNRTFLFAITVLASGLAMGAIGYVANTSTSDDTAHLASIEQIQQAKSYILQGTKSENLSAVVEQVGGNVSREFPIINAISAVLTPSQVEQIKQLGNVRVQDDRKVETMNINTAASNLAGSSLKSERIDNHISQYIEADSLHQMGITGKGITVAVVDSGANLGGNIGSHLFHDSFGAVRVPIKYDALTGTTNHLYNDDSNGHGTHVSSIIASSLSADNGKFKGIAPDVNLLPIKAFDHNGESSYSKVLDALNWIYHYRYKYKIKVVNLSLGAEVQSRYWQDPINQAVMKLWRAGIVVVTSAGNNVNDMGITVPGNTPYVITVGATTDSYTPFNMSDDRVTSFSARGPSFEGFVKPEIVAPGARIAVKMERGLIAKALRANSKGLDYSEISGTSQSSAVVTGVVALIIQNHPDIKPDDVKCKLVATAKAAKANGNLAYSPFRQGAGMVNAYDAVMSNASKCANQGLNIWKDLGGIEHYFGPVVKNESGKLEILSPSGAILTEGAHWTEGEMDLEGAHWSEGMLDLEGAHWSEGMLDVEGAHWSEGIMGLEGAHWTEGEIGLQGAHWTEGVMGLEGAHWSEGELGLEGAHWSEGAMGVAWLDSVVSTQAAESEQSPVDVNVEVAMDESAWQ